jgi:glutathione peroxidase
MKFIALLILSMLSITPFSGPASVYDFTMKSIDGKDVSLSVYKGKKLLIVNVASECGYTPQYKDLEQLSKKYAGKLVVLGFPANYFGGRSPVPMPKSKAFVQKITGFLFPCSPKSV